MALVPLEKQVAFVVDQESLEVLEGTVKVW